jgi:hypothetical protein
MPSFAAPTEPSDATTAEAAWQGADPAQLQQMQAMQEQMAAMRAQLEQQALQQSPQGARPGGAPPPANQPISGYRRPASARAPAPVAPTGPTPQGPDLIARARPSVEGSAYEAVLADDATPAPFGVESSPFARLEVEQAEAAAEPRTPPTAAAEADPAPVFRSEPQQLVSSDQPPPAPPAQEEEAGEVDRVMLAKEFSGLLQVGEDGDESSS